MKKLLWIGIVVIFIGTVLSFYNLPYAKTITISGFVPVAIYILAYNKNRG